MQYPHGLQITPSLFFKFTCFSISSERTSFFWESFASSSDIFLSRIFFLLSLSFLKARVPFSKNSFSQRWKTVGWSPYSSQISETGPSQGDASLKCWPSLQDYSSSSVSLSWRFPPLFKLTKPEENSNSVWSRTSPLLYNFCQEMGFTPLLLQRNC